MLIKAYGKINLFLKVVNKRDDGYHNIESIFLPIELHDVVSINMNNSTDDFVTCEDLVLRYNRYNLCKKAIDVAREKRKFKQRFNILIHKNLFCDAGLGGGSVDAAATLLGIVDLLDIKTSIKELKELALKVGSDVPWAICSKPAVVKNRGEIIEEFNLKKQYFCLLVKPLKGLSTKAVFDEYDKETETTADTNKPEISIFLKDLLSNKSLKDIRPNTYNDLEPTSIKMLPQIQDIKKELELLRFSFVLMTGSGSTVFALTTSLDKAKRAKKYFANKNLEVELTKISLGRKLDLPKE